MEKKRTFPTKTISPSTSSKERRKNPLPGLERVVTKVERPNKKKWSDIEGNKPPEAPEEIPVKLMKALKKYPPPPDKDSVFKAKWKIFIEDICERANFKPGHLEQLEILCDMFSELEEMKLYIKENGYSYESHGRNGVQVKIRPEVQQKNILVNTIKNFSKHLGITPTKDENFTDKKEKADEWK